MTIQLSKPCIIQPTKQTQSKKQDEEYNREKLDFDIVKEFISSKSSKEKRYEFKKPTDIYLSYDMIITARYELFDYAPFDYIVEIKSRNFPFEKYSDTYIDLYKWNKLNELNKEYRGIFIVMLYPVSNKIAMFNINNIPYRFEKIYANKNTEESRTNKVLKDVVMFDLKDALVYDYDLTDFYERLEQLNNGSYHDLENIIKRIRKNNKQNN